MIRVLDLVTCLIVFVWFYNGDREEGVFKVMKNDHFLVLLSVWVLSPKFLCRLKWLMLELHKIIRGSHVVACPIVFI